MAPAEREMQAFYFMVVFWGPVYRAYFTELLVASLLSPKNVPAVGMERRNRFLIVTTREDWEALQANETFQSRRHCVEPVWFEMPFPAAAEPKMLVMSRGHRQVAERAFKDRAYGVFLTPDLILSDGSVAAMERLVRAGKKVVLGCHSLPARDDAGGDEAQGISQTAAATYDLFARPHAHRAP